MSHSVDEAYNFYHEPRRRAAKNHTCDACKETIRKGHEYYDVTWKFEGRLEGVRRCLRCQVIHEHLRTLDRFEMWPDERLSCGEEYEEHWGKKPPAEIAELAFITGAELQRVQ